MSKEIDLSKLDSKTVRNQYCEKFDELLAILIKHDPLGLIALGAPEDEYDPEVRTIIVQLEKQMNRTEIGTLTQDEYLRWFDDAGLLSQSLLEKITNDVYIWLNDESL
ncbi:hypothetical protein [Phaeocystidibacter luteus]|uniref:Uncharacterized protein n=1 Tax=Phaeocystidibacter luteus TaxID=911197 RepID=A0A6N6RFT4_9FLAO|nr:hypothetical protein [Phaeocystidibacter luteus]KAB2810012.1 hypothetical protein F8C67_09025 [Phaeocystidibacter luteus]